MNGRGDLSRMVLEVLARASMVRRRRGVEEGFADGMQRLESREHRPASQIV